MPSGERMVRLMEGHCLPNAADPQACRQYIEVFSLQASNNSKSLLPSLDGSPLRIAAALQTQVARRLVHRLLQSDARGADPAIAAAAPQLGWPVEDMPAEWARDSLAADPIRDGEMLRRACALAAPSPWPLPPSWP